MSEHVRIEHLKVYYPIRQGVFRRTVGAVRAVDGVDLSIRRGAVLGLVGESGCGKSSLARAILRLQEPTAGRILLAGKGEAVDLVSLDRAALRRLRPRLQIVFQDPYSALNPRLSVGTILRETLRAAGIMQRPAQDKAIAAILAAVGLPASAAARYPHQFSGGQRQRVSIARALITNPEFVVLDEPVSALDVSVRAQILNLLIDLKAERGLTYLFVSHDLSVVRYLCDEVAVMYLGRVVERNSAAELFRAPRHPYTRALLSAVPRPEPGRARQRIRLEGDPPNPAKPPSGCAFHPRCPLASAICSAEAPALTLRGDGGLVACHHA